MHGMKQTRGWQETMPFSRAAYGPWTSKERHRLQHEACQPMRRRQTVRANFLPGAEPWSKPAAQSRRWPSSTHQGFGGPHGPKPVKRNAWNIGVSMAKKSNRNPCLPADTRRQKGHLLGKPLRPRQRETLGFLVSPTAKLGFGLPATRVARSTLGNRETQPYRFVVRIGWRSSERCKAFPPAKHGHSCPFRLTCCRVTEEKKDTPSNQQLACHFERSPNQNQDAGTLQAPTEKALTAKVG